MSGGSFGFISYVHIFALSFRCLLPVIIVAHRLLKCSQVLKESQNTPLGGALFPQFFLPQLLCWNANINL